MCGLAGRRSPKTQPRCCRLGLGLHRLGSSVRYTMDVLKPLTQTLNPKPQTCCFRELSSPPLRCRLFLKYQGPLSNRRKCGDVVSSPMFRHTGRQNHRRTLENDREASEESKGVPDVETLSARALLPGAGRTFRASQTDLQHLSHRAPQFCSATAELRAASKATEPLAFQVLPQCPRRE